MFVKYTDTDKISYKLNDFVPVDAESGVPGALPEYLLKELCSQVLDKKGKNPINVKTKKDGIVFQLTDIYQRHNALFFELEISNTTNISYDIHDFYWWIDDRKKLKATNVQEYQLEPVYQHKKLMSIPANTTQKEVFVLPKLTIPDKRILRTEMLEKALGNTGRKLSLHIKNRHILKAKSF